MRICLNVAITEMVIKKDHSGINDTSEVCEVMDEDVSLLKIFFSQLTLKLNLQQGAGGGGGEYDWDQQLQGLILSSFFFGYVITHVPGK